MARQTDSFPSHIGALYQDSVENIRFSKLQQWRVTNYAALIYALVFFIRREGLFTSCQGKAVLTAIIVVTLVFSLFVLWKLEDSISKFRDRVSWVYKHCFSEAQRHDPDLRLDLKTDRFDYVIFFGLMAVLISGAILATVLVWGFKAGAGQ